MLCLKKIIIGSGIFLPVLLSVFFVSPSYAIDDVIYNWDSTIGSTSPLYFCDDSSSTLPHCSDFSYLIYTGSSLNNFNYSIITLYNLSNSAGGFRFIKTNSTIIYLTDISKAYLSLDNGLRYGTFTLTNSLPGFSSCPDPEPCPSCPIVPENPYDNKFDEIKNAIYIIPAVLLLLYFFFCVYNIIIKNSRVK